MTGRAKALYERGLKELSGEDGCLLTPAELVRAMAAMLDQALPEKRTREGAGGKNLLRGMQALADLKEWAPDAVQWEPNTRGQVAALGQATKEHDGVAEVGHWLRNGGLDWMREKPTMQYVSRNYVDMLARARASRTQPSLPQEAGPLDKLRERGL